MRSMTPSDSAPAGAEPLRPPLALILEDLLELVSAESPFAVNFEDITGFTFDAAEFSLPERYRAHCSDFCLHAKEHQGRHRECTINKRICNRRATRGRGFAGMCYLGMTERVEPLCVRGKTLGVFYFGGVLILGRESEAVKKIRTFCKRKKIRPDGYLAALKTVPAVSAAAWEAAQERFCRMVRLASAYVESAALPVDSYTMHGIRQDVTRDRRISALARSAIAHIRRHYAYPLSLAGAAKALGCSAVHLSRTFKRDLGIPFGEFLHRVRIDHAKMLLRTRNLNANQVCYEVGFSDPSHFNRIFQRLEAMTPAEFARSGPV